MVREYEQGTNDHDSVQPPTQLREHTYIDRVRYTANYDVLPSAARSINRVTRFIAMVFLLPAESSYAQSSSSSCSRIAFCTCRSQSIRPSSS